jgi:FkbM family methyltransferase
MGNQPKSSEPGFPVFHAPNGLKIFHHAPHETKFVYREIFEDLVYFRHGINLKHDETVFDIGANIGLFTIFVKEKFKAARIYAFEPSPEIFEILKANTAPYGDSVTVCDCGIAGRPGEATFTYYPQYSIMSGFAAQADRDMQTLRAAVKGNLKQAGTGEQDIEDRHLDWAVQGVLDQRRQLTCRLRTISEIIDESSISNIGLLKIDAEGSELDILSGILPGHWSRIRQIAMEVHDRDGNLPTAIADLLQSRGFRTIFEHEKCLEGSGIVNCYALRSD